ncbi:MAG: glycoside hydrolase family 2 TIM barrel-domain containing protein, partial [Verrucomicrobiota bacterium]
MKRREFLKVSLSAAALTAVPACTTRRLLGKMGGELAPSHADNHALAPRRCTLLDFDWRFKPLPAAELKEVALLNQWTWAKEQPGQTPSMMAQPNLDTSGPDWKTAKAEDARMNFLGHAWFRTTLPDSSGPGRCVSFSYVVNLCDVYLNGKMVAAHQGWPAPFTVNLDPAWNENGSNVLAVRVQHFGHGSGGISGKVAFGRRPEPDQSHQYFSPDCDDSLWRKVELPHDYVVEGEYDSKANTSHGSLPVFPAWYRKKFFVDATDRDKCVWLYFEGVFREAKIYVNGKWVGRHPGGYTSFHVDIADAVNFGGENLLAVYADPTKFEGWWYEGGGIYRHVWLNVADQVHVAPWGVYVTSEVADVTGAPSATLRIETLVSNRTSDTQNCSVVSTVRDPIGRIVAVATDTLTVPSDSIPVDARERMLSSANENQPSYLHTGTPLMQSVQLSSARLWSLEERNRYTLVTEVSRDGKVVDRHVQKFGIRTLRFDPKEGFFLNEKSIKIKGTCNHQDFVGVGIGMTDSLIYYRMKRLQEFGCNAIRCPAHPMTPAMYEACDELGLLVMDDNRHPGSSIIGKGWEGQPYDNTWHVESLVLRDRNHPSVIMWCLWNEEVGFENKPFGRELMAALRQAVQKHDRTRPVTCANNGHARDQAWIGGAAESEDLLGVNYNTWNYDILHREFPDKMVFGSEIGSNTSCRGIYHTDNEAAHLTSYMSPDQKWEPVASRPFVAGGFYWTGFDYRGETAPFGWPEISSNFGFLDVCGFPKDSAFYWKAWWQRDQPLVHIFPHWNWPDKLGQTIPVWCFSNCDEVEL